MSLSEAKRRLAAILSADVAGYARLMSADEPATLAALDASRGLFYEHVARHEGRVVDTAGDSVLAVFDSVVEALACAVALQDALGARNRDLPEDQAMAFRIGVNLGDVIAKADGTIYGEGVNLAARLQALAEPGGVAVSGGVYDQVRNKLVLGYEFLGEQKVKNIADPVRVFRIRADGAPKGAEPGAPRPPERERRPDRPSIAVLPFANLGGGADQAYFADGIAEDIITELARYQELRVVARNSSFTYKDRAVDIQEVRRALNVGYVLEGSVRRAGNRVRITAQLVDAATGHHLWAERYDRELADVFAVQDEVTARIVATLAGKVEASERRRARDHDRPENLRAYELVLRGREHWNRFTREDNLEARRLYQRAIALDPDYARAYASLAWTYLIEADEKWAESPREALARALELARKGVAINPASHSNQLTLGQVYFWTGEIDKAVEAFERGIALNPNDPDGYGFLAYALCFAGEPERAVLLLDKAIGLSATANPWHAAIPVAAHFVGGREAEAVAAMERAPDAPVFFQRWYAAALARIGRLEDAQAARDRYLARYPRFELAEHLATVRFRRPEDQARYAEGLRRAGFA